MDDLISNLEIVLHNDPALDLREMDLRAYLETRDPSLVRELPGRTAKRFELRALDVVEASAVMAAGAIGTKVLLAVRHGLASVKGIDGPGSALRPSKEDRDAFGNIRATFTIDELNQLFGSGRRSLGSSAMVEIGMAIIDRFESGNADGGGVRFTLPPQSHPALEQNQRQRAERTRAESATGT